MHRNGAITAIRPRSGAAKRDNEFSPTDCHVTLQRGHACAVEATISRFSEGRTRFCAAKVVIRVEALESLSNQGRYVPSNTRRVPLPASSIARGLLQRLQASCGA